MSATPRIGEISYNGSTVPTVMIRPGLAAVIEFPKPIFEVHFGNTKNFKSVISGVYPKQLTIFVTDANSAPTNLIVKCEKRTFVLDILPSKTEHQDFTRVLGAPANFLNAADSKLVRLSPSSRSMVTGSTEIEKEALK